MFSDIPMSEEWISEQKLTKGWSDDVKYLITTVHQEKLLLRVSDIAQFEGKKKEYEMIKKYDTLGFEMSHPVDFGICNDGKNVYMLLTWVEGIDLEEVLPSLPQEEQYALGRKAGKILKKIHSLEVLAEDISERTKVNKKLMQLERYENSKVRIADDNTIIRYIRDNIDKIGSLPVVYQHGDFHPGNLIFMEDREIGVIDFNRWEVGDPYEEFYKLESFGIEVSIPYCVGQIDAYFEDNVPEEFWQTLTVYVAHASLYSIKWAEKFGQADIDEMVTRCKSAMKHYENFTRTKPNWYGDYKEEALTKPEVQ